MPFAMGNARLERRESVGVEMRGFLYFPILACYMSPLALYVHPIFPFHFPQKYSLFDSLDAGEQKVIFSLFFYPHLAPTMSR